MKRAVIIADNYSRNRAHRMVDEANLGDAVQCGKPTRTLEQNAKLWPMLEDIQQQVPGFETYSTDDIKLRFLNSLGVEMRFLPTLEGEGMFPVGLKSSTLTKEQFSGLIELLYAFGAKHGVRWSDPAERIAA